MTKDLAFLHGETESLLLYCNTTCCTLGTETPQTSLQLWFIRAKPHCSSRGGIPFISEGDPRIAAGAAMPRRCPQSHSWLTAMLQECHPRQQSVSWAQGTLCASPSIPGMGALHCPAQPGRRGSSHGQSPRIHGTVLCGYSCQYICFLRQITNANMPCHQCVEVTSAKQAGDWAAETSLRSLDAWGKRWEAHAQIIQLGIHTNISGHLQFTSVKFREGRGNKEEEKKKHHHHYKSI